MSWLSANAFFVIVLLLCVGLHLFHGHASHGGQGSEDDEVGTDDHRHQ